MNKKLEEKLVMLAFGDMSPEETERLEREVAGNREAMMVLDDYRGMRTGLKAIGEIPEHQLSTERLRHAVLNRGLKPKSRPQLGWLWMPTTAAVLAFGVFFFQHRPQTGTPGSFALGIDSSSVAPSTIDEPGDAFALATASGQISSVAPPAPAVTLVSHVTRHRTRNADSSHVADLMARVSAEFDNELMASANTTVPSSALASNETKPVSEAPIVLIDSTRDAQTGAQKATEVDSASNVIVGG